MNRRIIAVVIVAVGAFLSCQGISLADPPPGVGPLIWQEEFSGNSLSDTQFSIREEGWWGGGYNTPNAVTVSNGLLKITTYTDAKGRHNGAVVWTKEKVPLFTHGYFEARVLFNSSPGMWSAFWMESPTVGQIIGNPEQAGTEVDIVEHRVTDDEGRDLRDRYLSAIHWDGYQEGVHKWKQKLHSPQPGLDNGTWHVYGLLWTPEKYVFYFDGVPVWEHDQQVSQVGHFLEFSSLIEDGSWAGNVPAGGYGSFSESTPNMYVDWVRAYALHAPEPSSAAGLLLIALATLRRRRC